MLYLKNLRKQLEVVINNSWVSIDAAYYVVKDILNELTEIMTNEINTEVVQEGVENTPAAQQDENKTNE